MFMFKRLVTARLMYVALVFMALMSYLSLYCIAAHAQQSATGNWYGQAFASAARTATVNSSDIINSNFRGVHVIINTSAYVSGNFTPHIQGKDPISGTYYDILVGTAISSTGITILKVYPGIGAIANGSANDLLPRTWRVQMVGASTPSATFSVSFFLEQ